MGSARASPCHSKDLAAGTTAAPGYRFGGRIATAAAVAAQR